MVSEVRQGRSREQSSDLQPQRGFSIIGAEIAGEYSSVDSVTPTNASRASTIVPSTPGSIRILGSVSGRTASKPNELASTVVQDITTKDNPNQNGSVAEKIDRSNIFYLWSSISPELVTSNPISWNPRQVEAWLKEIGLSVMAPVIIEKEIDGKTLLQLTFNDLEDIAPNVHILGFILSLNCARQRCKLSHLSVSRDSKKRL